MAIVGAPSPAAPRCTSPGATLHVALPTAQRVPEPPMPRHSTAARAAMNAAAARCPVLSCRIRSLGVAWALWLVVAASTATPAAAQPAGQVDAASGPVLRLSQLDAVRWNPVGLESQNTLATRWKLWTAAPEGAALRDGHLDLGLQLMANPAFPWWAPWSSSSRWPWWCCGWATRQCGSWAPSTTCRAGPTAAIRPSIPSTRAP